MYLILILFITSSTPIFSSHLPEHSNKLNNYIKFNCHFIAQRASDLGQKGSYDVVDGEGADVDKLSCLMVTTAASNLNHFEWCCITSLKTMNQSHVIHPYVSKCSSTSYIPQAGQSAAFHPALICHSLCRLANLDYRMAVP